MSELEDILEKKQEKTERIGRFKVHSEHVVEIMEFVRKHGIEVEKAQYIVENAFDSPSVYQIRPDTYLLKTKYGPIEIEYRYGYRHGVEFAEVKYLCSTPEEEEEIKKLFHEEKKLKS